jgi:hypothetical protein
MLFFSERRPVPVCRQIAPHHPQGSPPQEQLLVAANLQSQLVATLINRF